MNVCFLSGPGDKTLARLGGKARSLAQLIEWGMPVPDGFAVTTEAYREHAARAGLLPQLRPLLSRQDHRGAAEAARRGLCETALTAQLEEQILAAWRGLGGPAVAVRSSATAEDLAGASFAGQHDTFLDICEPGPLLDAVKRCWASLWSERAVRYRDERRIAAESVAMAVVVQRMVPAAAAGVIFTADPLTQDRGRMLLEIVPGLGEALVSGHVRGESCLLDRGSTKFRAVGAPPRLLSPAQLRELAELAVQIEKNAGGPQDIEFAVAEDRIAILQARPITTLGDPVPPPPPLTYMDRRMQALTLERYAIAPRPLDNVAFVRMVGAAAYAAEQFGLVIDERDRAEFRRALWHQQYRLPRSRLTLRLLLHPLLSFGMLRKDWLSWWQGEPRRRLEATATPVDLRALDDAGLFERMDAILRVWEELTNQRFYAVSSVHAERMLHALVALAVGPKAAAKVTGVLLSGLTTPTSATNDALWELSRLARGDVSVAAAIRGDKWEEIPVDCPFAVALREFFARFGHRESGGFYLSLPTWRHDPTPIRQLLRTLLDADQRPSGQDSVPLDVRTSVERRLRWCPWLQRQFGTLLSQVRALHLMREESHFDLTRPLDVLQGIVAELARRLRTRGLIRADDDVFYLTFEEIRQWLLSGPPAGTAPNDLVARRRSTYRLVNARWQRSRPQPKAAGKVLAGTSGSPGCVRAVARIVLDETHFNRLRPGEVLVCPHSNPSWTPLFLTAAAVVSDTGGAASHAAIVAREYGLPAVLAVTGATQLIHDGEVIEVDGDRGCVTLMRAQPTEPAGATSRG